MSPTEKIEIRTTVEPEPDVNEIAFRIVQAATAEKPVEEPKPSDASADCAGGRIRATVIGPDERPISDRNRNAAG